MIGPFRPDIYRTLATCSQSIPTVQFWPQKWRGPFYHMNDVNVYLGPNWGNGFHARVLSPEPEEVRKGHVHKVSDCGVGQGKLINRSIVMNRSCSQPDPQINKPHATREQSWKCRFKNKIKVGSPGMAISKQRVWINGQLQSLHNFQQKTAPSAWKCP